MRSSDQKHRSSSRHEALDHMRKGKARSLIIAPAIKVGFMLVDIRLLAALASVYSLYTIICLG